MRNKIKVALVYGGKSGEHEVSLQSAKSVYEALDKDKYDIHLIGIDKTGRWLLGEASHYLLNTSNPKLIALNEANTKEITPVQSGTTTGLITIENGGEMGTVDVFFPIMHGTYGEDGSMQGMLELLNTAYVGAGVLGSAIGMDKDVMKRLLTQAGIPVTDYVTVRKGERGREIVKRAVEQFGFPLFVKPANMGSSVGVSKVSNKKELVKAVQTALKYDIKALIEKAVTGREIECSVLGNSNPLASVPGEVIPHHEFYSYEAKYIDENGAGLVIPAHLPADIKTMIQKTAVDAFKVLECSGMARVDFFLTAGGEIFVNEINTIPGFTKISMYPKLWEASGLSYRELLDRLIQLAIERKNEKDKLKRSYDL